MDDPTIDIKNIKYDFTNYMIKEINIIIKPDNTFTVKYDEKTRIYDILSVNPDFTAPVKIDQGKNTEVITIVKAKTAPGKNTPVKTDQVNNDQIKTDEVKTAIDKTAQVNNAEVIANSSDIKLVNKNDSLISTQTFINSTDLITHFNNLGFTDTRKEV